MRGVIAAVVPALVVAAGVGPGLADAGGYEYEGPGVVVADRGGFSFVDNGAVVCEDTTGDGVPDRGQGGVCIPFDQLPGGPLTDDVPAVEVVDDQVGKDVTFQVCVDNNGDNRCGFTVEEGTFQVRKAVGQKPECFDDIRFSHDSDGSNLNPLPVPSSFQDGCASEGGFPGVIVIVCSGAHDGHGGAHSHPATNGTISTTLTAGPVYGSGDFCGGIGAEKAYTVVNATAGG